MDYKEQMLIQREFMKAAFDESFVSDEEKKLDQPPITKDCPVGCQLIDLEKPIAEDFSINLFDAIMNRKSHRVYSDEGITLTELSFLLHATQGVRKISRNKNVTLRSVPSAGARQPYETVLLVQRVDGLRKGVYRYLPLTHQLVLLFEDDEMQQRIRDNTLG